MRYKNICLFLFVIPYLIQQVIDSLSQAEHGFPALISGYELPFGLLKFFPVSGCGFIFPEVLLLQPRFHSGRNPCDLRYMSGRIRRPDQRRIKNFICFYSLTQNLFSQLNRLLMTLFCKRDICGAADFIFYIPNSLSMADKIHMTHIFSLSIPCFSLSFKL